MKTTFNVEKLCLNHDEESMVKRLEATKKKHKNNVKTNALFYLHEETWSYLKVNVTPSFGYVSFMYINIFGCWIPGGHDVVMESHGVTKAKVSWALS